VCKIHVVFDTSAHWKQGSENHGFKNHQRSSVVWGFVGLFVCFVWNLRVVFHCRRDFWVSVYQ